MRYIAFSAVTTTDVTTGSNGVVLSAISAGNHIKKFACFEGKLRLQFVGCFTTFSVFGLYSVK
jgi:hypothetical protein